VIVDLLFFTFKLSLGCLFSPHHVDQGGVQNFGRPRKSLFTRPTLLKSLSGDAELAGSARYCSVLSLAGVASNISPEKKRRLGGYMGFIRERGLAPLLQASAGNGKTYTAVMIAKSLGTLEGVKILAPTNKASLNIGVLRFTSSSK
jgi:hypothetical protein